MKGHGREMIQLGVPIADAPAEGENMTGASKGMFYRVILFRYQSTVVYKSFLYAVFCHPCINVFYVLLIESGRYECGTYTFLV